MLVLISTGNRVEHKYTMIIFGTILFFIIIWLSIQHFHSMKSLEIKILEIQQTQL